jgi:carbon storage regulator CsrA
MLVLSRKIGETVLIDGRVKVTVLGLRGKQIRLGIEAPADVRVLRGELEDRPVESRPVIQEILVDLADDSDPPVAPRTPVVSSGRAPLRQRLLARG